MTGTFGPTALVTPANAVTLARVGITPLLLAWIVAVEASYSLLALWIVLTVTDGVDGYLARRHGTTRSGAFLDPLADKFLVLGALVCLVVVGTFSWVPVAVIAVREVSMSIYRSVAGRSGVSIPARRSAKVKTVLQEVAVGFALLPGGHDNARWVAVALLWIATALTVVTGLQYLQDGRRHAM